VRSGDDAATEIRDLTAGRGADVVVDFVGVDATLALAAAVARPLGHLTLVGIGGGSLPFSFFSVGYEVSLATTYWGSITELMEVLALARVGHIRAHTQTFPLDQAAQVYDHLAARQLTGRAVIVPT
jgi:propanol-preferring alcohol dehydrogenase